MNLRLIRNPRIVQRLSKPSAKWQKLATPIYPEDTRNKMLAVSALRGFDTQDGEPVYPSDLTNEQAADVARWVHY